MSQVNDGQERQGRSVTARPEPKVARIPRGLYAITDGPRADLVDVCAAALTGGASILQYRDKTGDKERRRKEAGRIAALCRDHDALLIVNDDVALAREIQAAGVHLGRDDVDVAKARELLGPQALIGVSCYNSLDRARSAAAAGANYLAFGAFFPSPTKPAAHRADPDLLCSAKPLGLPMVAIGGITADNGPPLIAAGAHCLAVISAVFAQADVEAAAQRIVRLFENET